MTSCEHCVEGVCQHTKGWCPPRGLCNLAQHRCLLYTGQCRMHRRVFGDLLPIEMYRNGGEGRHAQPVTTTTEGEH